MLRPVPISSPEGGRLLADLDEEQRLESWHLIRDGRRFSAGAAVPPLLRLLPGGSAPAWLAERMPRATQAGYSLVAASRSLIGPRMPAGAVERADARIRSREGPG